MPYNEKEYIDSNINYLNKDFNQYRNALLQYAKSYFPNTYKDFNESSPGMMLIEMTAYVGDVLSFYIDQQFQEMLLPIAKERKNVINIAKMLGYKVRTTVPAFTELLVKQTIPSSATVSGFDVNNIQPLYDTKAVVIDKGMRIGSSGDTNISFETLDVVDFITSRSYADGTKDPDPEPSTFDPSTGLVIEYTLQRKVRAVSGTTKTTTFDIGAPAKFRGVRIKDTNVIEILSVKDTNGNNWFEVDYLSQDKVPLDIHYTNDDLRGTAYSEIGSQTGGELVAIPYVLDYIKTSKRFVRETNEDNTTSLIFGNGIIRNGQSNLQTGFLQSLNSGVTYAGQAEDLSAFLSPLLGDSTATLGEVPSHTTLTVTYRVGGGVTSNVPAGDLQNVTSIQYVGSNILPSDSTLSVTNTDPAVGGTSHETLDEIRENAKAFFSTQNRCVTKDDYEARLSHMSPRYGSVAKVYVERIDVGGENSDGMIASEAIQYVNGVLGTIENFINYSLTHNLSEMLTDGTIEDLNDFLLNPNGTAYQDIGWTDSFDFNNDQSLDSLEISQLSEGIQARLGTVKIHLLSYDNNKKLIGDPWANTEMCSGCTGTSTPDLIRQNIKTYLEQYRIITDEVSITDGYIINFGVVFDVVAHKVAVKQQVKLACIKRIEEYFNIDKMQFRQPIYTSDLAYQLMSVDGVRAVNYVILTQDNNWISDPSGNTAVFSPPLYDSVMGANGLITAVAGGQGIYGYQYSFSDFYTYDIGEETHTSITQGIDGVILPSISPAVFELKKPNQNIVGVVR